MITLAEPAPILTLFDTNFPLERKIRAWQNLTPEKQQKQLARILIYIYFNPLSTSRQIADGTMIDRTSVTGRLGDPKFKKYFDESQEKLCSVTHEMVTAYQITQDGITYLEELK